MEILALRLVASPSSFSRVLKNLSIRRGSGWSPTDLSPALGGGAVGRLVRKKFAASDITLQTKSRRAPGIE